MPTRTCVSYITYGNAHDGHLLRYALAYNPSRGLPVDFAETFRQVVQGYPGATFEAWIRAVVFGYYSNTMTADIAAAISAAMGSIWDINRPNPYGEADLNNVEVAIRAQHRHGARLLLVPHSQGNIYANLVYDRLTVGGGFSAASVGIAGVAPPRAIRGPYITSRNDRVISGLRLIFRDTPAANVTIPVNVIDRLGHNFRDIYLARVPGAINAMILGAFSALHAPNVSATPLTADTIRGWAAWNNCVPGSPGAYACSDGRITGGEVSYGIVGTRGIQTRPGTFDEILGLATTQVTTCVNILIARKLARIAATGSAGGFDTSPIPGCSNGTDSSFETWAWNIYSSDGLQIALPGGPQDGGRYGYEEVRPAARPWCRVS